MIPETHRTMLVVEKANEQDWQVRREGRWDDPIERFDRNDEVRLTLSDRPGPLEHHIETREEAEEKAREICKSNEWPGYMVYEGVIRDEHRPVDIAYNRDYWPTFEEFEEVTPVRWESITSVPYTLTEVDWF